MVLCLSYQKLLHHKQHAKNQLNPYNHSTDFKVLQTGHTHFLTMPTQKSVK